MYSSIPLVFEVDIHANASLVWSFLCQESKMKLWMADESMDLEIESTWNKGSDICISGHHNGVFVNKGQIIDIQINRLLHYTHLSSVSHLENIDINMTHLIFELFQNDFNTKLVLTINGFANESIFKHMQFYWRTSMQLLKKSIESVKIIDKQLE
jgi:uncharacterized protein YndB with AHSA1/START domain